jgi:hypothetical protein
MQTMHPGPRPDEARSPSLMVFRLGGRRLAVRADELAGVQVWGGDVRIPSRTPYMNRLLRQGDEVLPVYDLGARLKLRPVGTPPLCLIAKHHKGKLAVCIDADLPILQLLGAVPVDTSSTDESDVLGTVRMGTEAVPIFSLFMLGTSCRLESLRM